MSKTPHHRYNTHTFQMHNPTLKKPKREVRKERRRVKRRGYRLLNMFRIPAERDEGLARWKEAEASQRERKRRRWWQINVIEEAKPIPEREALNVTWLNLRAAGRRAKNPRLPRLSKDMLSNREIDFTITSESPFGGYVTENERDRRMKEDPLRFLSCSGRRRLGRNPHLVDTLLKTTGPTVASFLGLNPTAAARREETEEEKRNKARDEGSYELDGHVHSWSPALLGSLRLLRCKRCCRSLEDHDSHPPHLCKVKHVKVWRNVHVTASTWTELTALERQGLAEGGNQDRQFYDPGTTLPQRKGWHQRQPAQVRYYTRIPVHDA